MKSICLFFLLSGGLTAHSQAIGVLAGRNLFPADYLAIQYFHPSNYPIQLAAEIFMESSSRNSLRYVSYGTCISLNYSSHQESSDKSALSYRLGLGITIQAEREPWIYSRHKDWNKIGFGFEGAAAGEWAISSVFSLSVYAQQRLLLKPALGNRQFLFGLGLIYYLSNE